jgi:hypothetical protein
MLWQRTTKFDVECVTLADGHYSRRTPGSRQFMPPGQTVVLRYGTPVSAIWGWWRPHPKVGIVPMNGLNGWTCTMFRRLSDCDVVASRLILDAELFLSQLGLGCGESGMITYVWDAKVISANPGYCYKRAGWHVAGQCHDCVSWNSRTADNKKTLLHKPFHLAGMEHAP